MYQGIGGYIPFCRDCITKEYDKWININGDTLESFKIVCMKFNIPFDIGMYEGAMKETNSDKYGEDRIIHPFRIYMKSINSLGGKNNVSDDFDCSELFKSDTTLHNTSFSEKTIDQKMQEIREVTKLDKNDLVSKSDVINLIGYDPFFGQSEFDQKFLYNELLPYLDEDMMDDSYKLSQVLQIVNNNNQVRKLDLSINLLSSTVKDLMENDGKIKSLTSIKKSIADATNNIAKENAISVKNRSDKKAGKSTLTKMMKDLREMGFKEAEMNYYDQLTCEGMRKVMDISNKSIMDQLRLDENDYNDMILTQKELIESLQSKIDDLEEEIRKLYAGEIVI